MKSLKVTSFDGKEIIVTDPANVNNTFRQRHTVAKKNASDGSPLTNVRNEFSLNATASVPGIVDGARQPSETISVKIITSGSTANEAYVSAALDDAYFNAKRAIAAGALKGFILQPTDTENQFVFESSIE